MMNDKSIYAVIASDKRSAAISLVTARLFRYPAIRGIPCNDKH